MSPQEKYDKSNTKMYAIKVIKTTEADIYEKLESVDNKAGYIKQLIRNDISKSEETVIQSSDGMTDYQFRAFLRLLRGSLESSSKEKFLDKLDKIIEELN